MRILILGAGALGGYFGGRLLAAHRDVTFLVRPRSAQALAERGLRILSPHAGDLSLPHPPTVLAADLHAHFDLILLSAKAYDLADAMDAIAPAVGPDTAILPLLNGMAHMALLDQRFGPAHVLGGTCHISAVREPDGAIRHLNHLDALLFGDRSAPNSPRMQAIAATLANANFLAEPRPVILQDMWDKWSFLATLAGITCLMRAAIGDIEAVGANHLTMQLYSECIAVAAAEGYPATPSFRAERDAILTKQGSLWTASMLRDLEEGSRIEAQHILGDLLDRARRLQLATPLLELATAHVRCYQQRRIRESTQP